MNLEKQVSVEMLKILFHTLGISVGNNLSYRNHYVQSETPIIKRLIKLELFALVKENKDDNVYKVTNKGKEFINSFLNFGCR